MEDLKLEWEELVLWMAVLGLGLTINSSHYPCARRAVNPSPQSMGSQTYSDGRESKPRGAQFTGGTHTGRQENTGYSYEIL